MSCEDIIWCDILLSSTQNQCLMHTSSGMKGQQQANRQGHPLLATYAVTRVLTATSVQHSQILQNRKTNPPANHNQP
jgi:hypothetical protein